MNALSQWTWNGLTNHVFHMINQYANLRFSLNVFPRLLSAFALPLNKRHLLPLLYRLTVIGRINGGGGGRSGSGSGQNKCTRWIFSSVLTADRMGTIQPRHPLWGWGMEGIERDRHLFCGIACVADARRGKGRRICAKREKLHVSDFPYSPSPSRPATQAICGTVGPVRAK